MLKIKKNKYGHYYIFKRGNFQEAGAICKENIKYIVAHKYLTEKQKERILKYYE